jgi:hypothetical protein
MIDPVEYFFPKMAYKKNPFNILNVGLVSDLIASEKRSNTLLLNFKWFLLNSRIIQISRKAQCYRESSCDM